MKLTLIHPCIGREREAKDYIKTWQMEPLPPATLAGCTPADVEIKFYDDRLEAIPYDESTDLVALSVETYTAKRSYQIASEYRKRGIPVVMGGFHATLVPEEVTRYAEAIVIGEAEEIWPTLIEDFRGGRLKRIYHQSDRADLKLTRPNRMIFQGKRYLNIGLVEAGRGCHYRCDFCAIQTFFHSTQIRRPIQPILEEIRNVNRKLLFFVDDNITSNLEEAKEFYKALIPLKIRWVSQASINVAFNDEFLQILKDSGCFGLLIGFETLKRENLSAMNKDFNRMKGGYDAAIANLRKFGIRLYPTFIFGYPEDDEDSFRLALDFCKRHRPLIVSFNHLTPFPGTPLYERLSEQNQLLMDRWWLNPNYRYGDSPLRTRHLNPNQIKEYCIQTREAYFSIPSILRRAFDSWNIRDRFSLQAYFLLNWLFRKEIRQREGLPLGDLGHEIDLIPTRESLDCESKRKTG